MRLQQKSVDVINLKGGIDVASTFIGVSPGAAIGLQNFEPELEGGYRRINGYERVDGRAAPSAAVYYTVKVADSSGIAVGATLTGGTSGATSEVIAKDDDTNTLGVTALSGSYQDAEAANGTTITETEVQAGLDDYETDEAWQLAAENYYRDLIDPAPGDGNVLGAVQYGATKYAFRADSGAVKMYKSSASGWTLVPFFHYMFFDAGVLDEGDIVAGTTITGATSGATATVKKFIKNAGSYASDASGYMVLDVTSGTFQDNENIQVSAVTMCVADGANAAITLAEGGLFEFLEHNFFGSADTEYLYGCCGANFGWEFDGEVLTPIFFPAPTKNPSWNTPKYLAAFNSHLFLSFPGGRLGSSSIGEPLVFSALLGADEFGLGHECTGLVARAGNVLAVYTDELVKGIYGTDSQSWEMRIIGESFGAKDYTVQTVGTVYALDSKGIAPLDRVQAFGDFESATVSRKVRPLIEQFKNMIVGSCVVKERNQYRLYFTDGSVLVMGDDNYLGDSLPAFSTLKYPHIPTCISASKDASNNEVILFGDADGYVYQAEVGNNFDGEAIEWYLRTPFLYQKAPHMRKAYKRLYIDVAASRRVPLSISTELSYGDPLIPPDSLADIALVGGGGYWEVADWLDFYWDAPLFASQGVPLSGTGNNISLLISGSSASTRPFTIQSFHLHYLSRRIRRA